MSDELIGRTLDHFHVREFIGRGAQGVVYLARDQKLAREVALKLLPPGSETDPGARDRLLREARTAAALKPHEHLGTIYSVGSAEGRDYIAMEYVPGPTLRRVVVERGPLRGDEVRRLGAQIARALAHAHGHGMIHRDLKSDNVVVMEGKAKLLDFGLAEGQRAGWMPSGFERGSELRGTLAYLAPELIDGHPADRRTDLWALGVLLHEMATGSFPFSGATPAEMREAQRAPLTSLPRRLPAALRSAIRGLLEIDRARRIASAERIAELLDGAGRRRPRALAAAIVGGAVLALLAVGLLLRQATPPDRQETPVIRSLTAFEPGSGLIVAALSHDGRRLAFADSSGYHVLRLETHDVHDLPGISVLPPTRSDVASIELSWFPDDAHLLVSGPDPQVGRSAMWTVESATGAVLRLGEGEEAEASPSGEAVAFLRHRESDSEVWMMRPDGRDPRRLARSNAGERYRSIVWSPRGERVAYLVTRDPGDADGATRIEARSARGGPPTTVHVDPRLHAAESPGKQLCWLDQRLVFCRSDSTDSDAAASLWTLTPDRTPGASLRRLARSEGWMHSALSATVTGGRLAFLRSRQRSGVGIARLADGPRVTDVGLIAAGDALQIPMGWTADGRSVLSIAERDGATSVLLQPLDSLFARPIAESAGRIEWAGASSDGRWILYTERVMPSGSAIALFRVAREGGVPEAVARFGPEFSGIGCAPSRGTPVVLCEQNGDRREFFALNVGTGARTALASLRWDPRDRAMWALAPDGRHVALPSIQGDGTRRMRVLDLRGGGERSMPQPDFENAEFLAWASDGGAWFGAPEGSGHELLHVSPSGAVRPAGHLEIALGLVSSPDGRALAFGRRVLEANVWAMEKP